MEMSVLCRAVPGGPCAVSGPDPPRSTGQNQEGCPPSHHEGLQESLVHVSKVPLSALFLILKALFLILNEVFLCQASFPDWGQ